MKKLYIIMLGILFLFSSVLFAEKGKKYGNGVSLKETTKISTILENPKSFVGKKVLVSGTIVGVCAHKGCWIDVAGDKEFEKIKIKVNDGEIVFPLTAKGKSVLVEGIVEEIIIPKEQVATKTAETVEKNKNEKTMKTMENCDNCSESENKSEKIYRIKGTGAIIK